VSDTGERVVRVLTFHHCGPDFMPLSDEDIFDSFWLFFLWIKLKYMQRCLENNEYKSKSMQRCLENNEYRGIVSVREKYLHIAGQQCQAQQTIKKVNKGLLVCFSQIQ